MGCTASPPCHAEVWLEQRVAQGARRRGGGSHSATARDATTGAAGGSRQPGHARRAGAGAGCPEPSQDRFSRRPQDGLDVGAFFQELPHALRTGGCGQAAVPWLGCPPPPRARCGRGARAEGRVPANTPGVVPSHAPLAPNRSQTWRGASWHPAWPACAASGRWATRARCARWRGACARCSCRPVTRCARRARRRRPAGCCTTVSVRGWAWFHRVAAGVTVQGVAHQGTCQPGRLRASCSPAGPADPRPASRTPCPSNLQAWCASAAGGTWMGRRRRRRWRGRRCWERRRCWGRGWATPRTTPRSAPSPAACCSGWRPRT